jgi:hypothetical protein
MSNALKTQVDIGCGHAHTTSRTNSLCERNTTGPHASPTSMQISWLSCCRPLRCTRHSSTSSPSSAIRPSAQLGDVISSMRTCSSRPFRHSYSRETTLSSCVASSVMRICVWENRSGTVMSRQALLVHAKARRLFFVGSHEARHSHVTCKAPGGEPEKHCVCVRVRFGSS